MVMPAAWMASIRMSRHQSTVASTCSESPGAAPAARQRGYHDARINAGKVESVRSIHPRLCSSTALRGGVLDGLSVEKGASAPDLSYAETKKLMASIAAKVILLLAAGKRGRASFALFAPLDATGTILTYSISTEERARLEASGVDVLVTG